MRVNSYDLGDNDDSNVLWARLKGLNLKESISTVRKTIIIVTSADSDRYMIVYHAERMQKSELVPVEQSIIQMWAIIRA